MKDVGVIFNLLSAKLGMLSPGIIQITRNLIVVQPELILICLIAILIFPEQKIAVRYRMDSFAKWREGE